MLIIMLASLVGAASSAQEVRGTSRAADSVEDGEGAAEARSLDHRQLSDGECLTTCYGYSCDYWSYTCAELESAYGCDCTNCYCGVFPSGSPTHTVEPSVSPAPTIQSFPLLVTGSCVDDINDIYTPVRTTRDGRWYFQGVSNGGVLYFDRDCDGGTYDGVDRWIFDFAGTQVSTTAESDLDGSGDCSYQGRINDDGAQPPLGTNMWRVDCGGWTYRNLTITQTTLPPTASPTVTAEPSVSPAPTEAPTDVPTAGPSISSVPTMMCVDTDNGAADPYGDACDTYIIYPGWCGNYDDSDFSSSDMCCACGGGAGSAFPTQAPTTPGPTSSPIEVAAYPALRMSVAAMGEGEVLRLTVATDITFPNDIDIEGDRIVHLFGDAAASRPMLSGGGTTRFFQVWFGAALELRHFVLADGYAQDDGTYYSDDRAKGGAILVYESTLVLIGCVLRSCFSGYYVSDLWDCSSRDKVPYSLVAWNVGWRTCHRVEPCRWVVHQSRFNRPRFWTTRPTTTCVPCLRTT